MGHVCIFLHSRLVDCLSASSDVFILQELQESEVCQDELTLRVKQLKAELVLFKGLVSNVRVSIHHCSKYGNEIDWSYKFIHLHLT